MEDRSGRGMQMMAAAGAGPRLALLFGRVALEGALAHALGAFGVFPIRRVAGPPQMLQAGVVVGELDQELMDRVLRGRGLRPDRLVAVSRWHVSTVLDKLATVKSSLQNRGIVLSRERWLAQLDPGIAPLVDALDAAGIETFESCQGGTGHAFPEPTIRFYGNKGEGFRALALAITFDLPVSELRRYWQIVNGEPEGPHWELTFST